jgi:diguanylate cyclase
MISAVPKEALQAMLGRLLEFPYYAIAWVNAQGTILESNSAFRVLSGFIRTDWIVNAIDQCTVNQGVFQDEIALGTKKNTPYCIEALNTNTNGSPTLFLLGIDIAEGQNQCPFYDFFNNAQYGFFQATQNGFFTSVNSYLCQLLQCKNTEEVAQKKINLFAILQIDSKIRKYLELILFEKKSFQNYEVRLLNENHEEVWISVSARKVTTPESCYIDGSIIDITQQRKNEERLYRLAYFNTLTTMPNREKLVVDLNNLTDAQAFTQNAGYVLFTLDIDRFKVINDTLGPVYGDLLIQEVGRRLSALNIDQCLAYSLGADEYALLIQMPMTPAEIEITAQLIRDTIGEPILLQNRSVICTVSMGSVCSNFFTNPSADILLRASDSAMTKARKAGGDLHLAFSMEMFESALHRLEIEEELRKAILQNDFSINYQPIVMENPRKVVGCEALLRWKHPDRGFISPVDFIPISEETGLIIELGQWILREAMAQVKQWHQEGFPDLYVSINISVQQFQNGDLAENISNLIDELEFPKHLLKLEITESTAMKNVDYTVSTFRKLNQMGIQLSIDDFGTGYSSLAYIKEFSFHNLKIDRSFVKDLTERVEDNVLVQTIATMAENLNLQVIAEGVETEEQLNALKKMGLNYYQGYYFGKPQPPELFTHWMTEFNLHSISSSSLSAIKNTLP